MNIFSKTLLLIRILLPWIKIKLQMAYAAFCAKSVAVQHTFIKCISYYAQVLLERARGINRISRVDGEMHFGIF